MNVKTTQAARRLIHKASSAVIKTEEKHSYLTTHLCSTEILRPVRSP